MGFPQTNATAYWQVQSTTAASNRHTEAPTSRSKLQTTTENQLAKLLMGPQITAKCGRQKDPGRAPRQVASLPCRRRDSSHPRGPASSLLFRGLGAPLSPGLSSLLGCSRAPLPPRPPERLASTRRSVWKLQIKFWPPLSVTGESSRSTDRHVDPILLSLDIPIFSQIGRYAICPILVPSGE